MLNDQIRDKMFKKIFYNIELNIYEIDVFPDSDTIPSITFW